ncbi:MAG: hypothetical protein E7163_00950 [Firmicutes bacterium]|nr:hypothetical protein [Bacillota bacterium]
MKRNGKLLLIILLLVLVVTIGISYAYFIIGVNFNVDTDENYGKAPGLLKVDYNAGTSALTANGIMPGDSISKDFSVTVTPTDRVTVTYVIKIDIDTNTFKKCDDTTWLDFENECIKNANELVYTLKDDKGIIIANGYLEGKTGDIIIEKKEKKVTAKTTYNYNLTLEFKDTDADQNHNVNATFIGNLIVEFADKNIKFDNNLYGNKYILANTTLQTDDPDFSKTSCTKGTNIGGDCGEETVGLYKCIIKEDGKCAKQDELSSLDTTSLNTTYYYRGDVDDNYVEFAGFYWRIIRINENGSLRMIYQGRAKDDGKKLEIQKTGSETRLAVSSAFNTDYNRAEYVGFKYELENAHGTDKKSTILSALETWYTKEDNELQNYEEYLDTESGFCGDRSLAIGPGIGTATTQYRALRRMMSGAPSFKCSDNESDLYKTKIGLITADEIVYAGGIYWGSNLDGASNFSYYLYTEVSCWTLTPSHFNETSALALAFAMFPEGILYYDYINRSYGIRPVINLSAENLSISGSGTINNPYVIS